MESTTSEIAMNFTPFLRIYKDGRVERILGTETVPPGLDPKTNVDSKDFQKLTSLLSPLITEELPSILSLLLTNYDDSWDALKWVASHHGGNGPEEWLNRYADFDKVYFSGDSAGANIAHHIAVKTSKENPDGVNLAGIVLVHPYFWGEERIGDESKNPATCAMIEGSWCLASPTTSGLDDPWFNPMDDQSQSLASLGCKRVLVCVADGDLLKDRGRYYVEKLKQSGWEGEAELMETQGEEHVFHLRKLTCENALAKLRKVVAFIN
ncbi:Alpha/beta hydrolase-3 [Corchorus olitorius]|uniref:Alpha/beta hydrolase-3 n=1 Tax=Corchorus olitorius TaxID=93759 RepID=A0A1R3GYM7_9ROSI|nr:Alpha/beta hydrolase-3 [Corchorus olitorius]